MITFIDFFKKRGYKFLIKNNVINYNKSNSELLFINSGIAGILDMYLNEKIDKLVTVQTCLRIDGKHNDFDNIGNSKSHFSSFKMLGTFSNHNTDIFEMIKDIYDFIVSIIPFKNLYVTVHKNDNKAREMWKKIDSSLDIIDDETNSWSMGETGPRGYCTEIYYYDNSNDKKDAVELWNIVMINQTVLASGEVVNFNNIGLDTGGGLERLYSIFDDKHDVYLIDDSFDIINYLLNFFSFDDSKVILDTVKLINLMLNNNVTISNNKHGYILKKTFRKLIKTLSNNNKFIEENIIYIFSKQIKKLREFLYILKHETIAIKKCDTTLINYTNNKKGKLEIEDIVKLHNTYGVHFTNTLNLLKVKYKNDYNVEEIKKLLYKTDKQKGNNIVCITGINKTKFIYDAYELKMPVNILIYNESLKHKLKNIDQNNDFCIIADETIFYPEGGGQSYDTGYITLNNKTIASVNKVLKHENMIIHYCHANELINIEMLSQSIMKINIDRRKHLAISHCVHHILLHVIENLVCENVCQQSSNINIDKTTLSFYSIRKISDIVNEEQLSQHLNKKILSISSIKIKTIDTESAINNNYKSIMVGYDNVSRAIEIYDENDKLISKELCCGTHMIDKNVKVVIEKISEQNAYITKISFKLYLLN